MRLTVAILVIALFGAISANKALFKELNEINKHPFGATLLAAISTNIKAKTPLSDVSDTLARMAADLQSISDQVDNTYTSTRDSLVSTRDATESLIEVTSNTISSLEDAIEQYEARGSSLVAEFNEAKETLATSRAALEQLNSKFEEDTTNFDEDLANLSAAIQASNLALDRLATFKAATGAALVQVATSAKSHLTNYAKVMKGMVHKISKHGSMYAPLITELVELTQDVDPSKVSTVIGLLNDLLNLLQAAVSDLQTKRSADVADYENQRTGYESSIDNAERTISTNEEAIAEVGDQLVQRHADLDNANTNLQNNQQALERVVADLETVEANYAHDRPHYDRLLAILARLRQHFDENLAAVNEWTASQINGEI